MAKLKSGLLQHPTPTILLVLLFHAGTVFGDEPEEKGYAPYQASSGE